MKLNPRLDIGSERHAQEIASHGLRWIDYVDMPEEEERVHMAEAVSWHTTLTGSRPLGWYTGRNSTNTRRLAVEEGGFLYDADSYSDDLPYYEAVNGAPHLVVPYTFDVNDQKFASPNSFDTGEEFLTYLKETFDALYAEGGGPDGEPKMMSVGLHCRLAGRPARAAAVAKFVDYMLEHERVRRYH
jgi:peptidoglycan/xylan/chitin deacetylase (PgdA/CDA1 family)